MPPIARATLYATARGIFEFRANGQRVSEDLFAPEWTDYDKRIQYRTYDVTALLTQGRNALAATLGDGWWTGYVGWQETRARYGSLENSLLAQLEVELTDGKKSWRVRLTKSLLGRPAPQRGFPRLDWTVNQAVAPVILKKS